jgi:hypothetical protein
MRHPQGFSRSSGTKYRPCNDRTSSVAPSRNIEGLNGGDASGSQTFNLRPSTFNRPRTLILAFLVLVFTAVLSWSAESAADLEQGFRHPPDAARPWVYAFWMNGNVTSNGITADLEAIKRVGIGGVLLMDVDQGTPPGPVVFGTQQWRELFAHLCAEARRLGLQVNLNNDPGWCGSGGPWVTPELSMQKVVWTETQVEGPSGFDGPLCRPEAFQDFYRDIAVLAFPVLEGDSTRMIDFGPEFSSSSGSKPNLQLLTDQDPNTKVILPLPAPGQPTWLLIHFLQPYTARQMTLDMGLKGDQICHGVLQVSSDGQKFELVREFDVEESSLSLSFPAVTARYFRLLFPLRSPDLEQLAITSLEFSPRARIEHVDAKAMFARKNSYPGPSEFPGRAIYPTIAPGLAVDRSQVLNLSDRLDGNGHLRWDAPAGSWTVLRIGHTSNGTDNHPAPQGGHGLECDKLSKAGVQVVFDGFLRPVLKDIKELAPGTLVSTHIDSWEVGSQNWTADFPEQFQRRRGYDPLLFLPTMTGRFVDGPELSERFLWDLRQTVSELVVENYAGHLRRLAHESGLRLSTEAYDGDPCIDLDYASQADEPMAEFWILPPYEMDYSCAEMASAAHVYGKPIVGAEAFTATAAEKWLWHPALIKSYGDWAFCEGINRFVVHRYAFQPWTNPNREPGISMGPFGLHYERTETWWEQSKAWHDYLARCQFLLQQGRFVGDICFLAPEFSPQHSKVPLASRERVGYSFDLCSPNALLARATARTGKLFLPDGMSYRVLVLPESETMTPRLLAKLKELIQAGATVIGPKPVKSPSLAGYPECDLEVARLAKEIWGDCDGRSIREHRLGKGKIIWGKTSEEVLAEAGVAPDFEPTTPGARDRLRYLHRTVAGNEIYFVANSGSQEVETTARFRVEGRQPELWWPDKGTIEKIGAYELSGRTVQVPLRLDAFGSVFVVFRSDAKAEKTRVTSITRNGTGLLELHSSKRPGLENPVNLPGAAIGLPASVADGTNTFTMAVWAKPGIDIELPPESNFGKTAYAAERNDALFPPAGHDLYHRPDEAGAGLSIGQNGICVFEHTADYFAPILVFAAALTNWTHVAVVYHHGKPSLYLNGALAHTGQQSSFVVHSGVGVKHRRRAAAFDGGLGEFFGAPRAFEPEAIRALMSAMPVPQTPLPPVVSVRRAPTGAVAAEIWEPGDYVLQNARGKRLHLQVAQLPTPLTLEGAWEVSFPPHWGAPERVRFDHLIPWTDHTDEGVRHFSGTAIYRKQFVLPEGWLGSDDRVYLDLGKVAVMANLRLNGKDLGTLWKPPYKVEITDAVRPGENSLEVSVVNLWPNRMIGDESLPEDSDRNSNGSLKQWPKWLQEGLPNPAGRYTFTSWRLWKAGSPLRASGLLGPVKLIPSKVVRVN